MAPLVGAMWHRWDCTRVDTRRRSFFLEENLPEIETALSPTTLETTLSGRPEPFHEVRCRDASEVCAKTPSGRRQFLAKAF